MDLQSLSLSPSRSETGTLNDARFILNNRDNHNAEMFRDSASMAYRQSSSDFAQQIKQLEMEGNKLRVAATSGSLFQITSTGHCAHSGGDVTPEKSRALSTNLPSLSSLVDISNEQKTIADLRVQLEQQQKESDQLQSHLLRDGMSGRSGIMPVGDGMVTVGDSMSGHSFVTVPTAKSAFSTVSETAASSRIPFEFVPPSHLERALKESQEQVGQLRKKLYETNEKADSQKRQFRVNVEELRGNLHETIVNRDTILELRQKEAASHETLISKLQSTVQQLQEKHKSTDKALVEVTRKLEVCDDSCCATEAVLNQVKTLLTEREKKRGKPYFDSDVGQQKTSMLSHVLERCLDELECELEEKTVKLSAVEEELSALRSSSSEKEKQLNQHHEETLKRETEDASKRVSQVSCDLEQQLESANERAKNARAQASALQSQLDMLESQLTQQTKLKEDTICELESKISQLKQDYGEDRTKWQQRREDLERTLDETRREMTTVRSEKDESSHKYVAMETRTEHLQNTVSHLQSELDGERERNTKQREREESLHTKLMTAEMEVSHKQQDVDRLEKMLEVVKQECSNQVKNRVANVEKLERDRHTDRVTDLQSQLTGMTEKFHKITVELQITRSESDKLKQQVQDFCENQESLRKQLETTVQAKEHLSQIVGDLKQDIERLHSEKEYYFNLVDQKNEVLSQVNSHKDRLAAQLEEKARNLITLKQQSDNISQLVEENSKTSENIREEKERILVLLTEKMEALKEMEVLQENMSKKLALRDDRVADVEDENRRMVVDLGLRTEQVTVLQQEKEKLYQELKESRVEVASITADKQKTQDQIIRHKAIAKKEITRLQAKLKSAESDLMLAQKTMRSTHSLDNKAVRYADKMQKEITNKRSEVDSLLSKMRKLEDKLDVLLKEKSAIQKDKDQLKKALMKSFNNCQQLSEELDKCVSKNNKLQEDVSHLEEAVQKAIVNTAASQAQLEGFEQEMTRAKINHQLDLKEAEQIAHTRSPRIQSGMVQQARPARQPLEENGGSEPRTTAAESRDEHPAFSEQHMSDKKNQVKSHDSRRGYREVGQELKILLGEMRSLIDGQREVNKKSRTRPRQLRLSAPGTKSDRHTSSSPDVNCPSDSEVSAGWKSRTDFSEFSYDQDATSSSNHHQQHPTRRRSYSADIESSQCSTLMSHDENMSTRSQISISQSNSPARSSYRGTRLCDSMLPYTQDLCKHLEKQIENLSKMGGNLQKENKDMADLMSTQGRKLQVARENERRLRKNPR